MIKGMFSVFVSSAAHSSFWPSCSWRRTLLFGLLGAAGLAGKWAAAQTAPASASAKQPQVAAIYFPGFHRDDHYDAWFGEGWNEWNLLLEAKPRFPGHRFFRPDWGAFDEADPSWMEKQIDLAARHGIDVFIFDWYWYSGVRFLYRPLEEGLLRASNRQKLKYALMWANHDWKNYFPSPADGKPTLWFPSRATPGDFQRHIDFCIARHFNQPNYWRVEGGLYFAVFQPETFVEQLGGQPKAQEVVNQARRQVEAAGLGKLHLAGFVGSPESAKMLRAAGFDSLTTYNLTASGKASFPDHPLDEYSDLLASHFSFWKQMDTGVLPYGPIVTVGWDPSPRWVKDGSFPPPNVGYPYTTVVVHNTPELFGELCRKAVQQFHASRLPPPAIFINAWNEWTEGSALLPDREYKTQFLEQLRQALSSQGQR